MVCCAVGELWTGAVDWTHEAGVGEAERGLLMTEAETEGLPRVDEGVCLLKLPGK